MPPERERRAASFGRSGGLGDVRVLDPAVGPWCNAVPAAGTRRDVTLGLRLERFGWGGPEQLELVGRWYGVDDPAASAPALLVHTGSDVERLEPVPGSVLVEQESQWSATFAYHGDPAVIERVELVMGDDLFVELPLPLAGRRRFGRTLLRAFRTPRAARSPVGAAEAAAPPEAPERVGAEVPDGAPTGALELHGALIRAQEEIEELRAATSRATELAEVARHDAEREHRRRVADTDRLREALATARALADEQLAAEREASAILRSELEAARHGLDVQRGQLSQHEAELEGLRRAGAAGAVAERERAAAFEAELAGVRAELEERTAEAAALSAALEQARHGEQVTLARSQALQQRVEAALAAIGDAS